MNTLVAAGFWMFWPTITALIQELTPGEEFVHANTFLMAGIQGGLFMAGCNRRIRLQPHRPGWSACSLTVSTYVVSFLCYFVVRKGKHIVPRPAELKHDLVGSRNPVARFLHEMSRGSNFSEAT